MSDKLTKLLWSGPSNSLCGVALGDEITNLQLPEWWKDEHSDGKVRYGWFDVGEGGVDQAVCSVTLVFGRVSRIDVSLELADSDAERPNYDALIARLRERLSVNGEKDGKKSTRFGNVAGSLVGDFSVRLSSFDSNDTGPVYRVEIDLSLAAGESIKADPRALFVDVDAVADVLQSQAFPRDTVREFCAAFFAHSDYWGIANADCDRMRAMQQAVAAERPGELPALATRLLSLARFADLKYGESPQAHYLLAGVFHFSLNNSSVRWKAPPAQAPWVKTNLRDLCALLGHLDVAADQRTAWALTIFKATEEGDVAAADAVKAALGDKRCSSSWLVLDSDELIEARCFDLLCGACPDDDARYLLPLGTSSYASSLARAAVAFFVHVRGVTAPTLTIANTANTEHRTDDWARWLVFGKEHRPACYSRAVAGMFEDCKFNRVGLRQILDAVCDQKAEGPTTTWTLGDNLVTHSGKPDGGRFTLKAAKPPKAATKKPATKKAATKKAAKAEPSASG